MSSQLALPSSGFNSTIWNSTYPTAYGSAYGTAAVALAPTGVLVAAALATGTTISTGVMNSNATCGRGSLSLYLGTIQGQEDFPLKYALQFSNGQCGYLSVWPIPVDEAEDVPTSDAPTSTMI